MKILIHSIFVFVLALFCFTAFAQQEPTPASFNAAGEPNLNSFIAKYIMSQSNHKGLDTMCKYGCAFLRFKITNDGNIIGAEVSEGIDDVLSQYLVKAITATSNHWEVQKDLVERRYFVLPVMYFFDRKCKLNASPRDESLNNISKMLVYPLEPNQPNGAFFGSYTGKPMDCIVLPPLYLSLPFK